MYRSISALVLVGLLITACADRYRDPCGYTRAETTTTYRTKNKALGWIPSSTVVYEFNAPVERQSGPKC